MKINNDLRGILIVEISQYNSLGSSQFTLIPVQVQRVGCHSFQMTSPVDVYHRNNGDFQAFQQVSQAGIV